MRTSSIFIGALIMTLVTSSINGASQTARATFAGGCFWCMVAPFETIDGVEKVTAGYTGGSSVNPTYEEVCTGKSGHIEAVQVLYDPSRVNYTALLDAFWRNVNPTDRGGQFADRGKQYTTAIFYHDESQKSTAEASRKALEASAVFEDAIVTPILPAKPFYPAEEYHQEYHEKNPQAYKRYRDGSGRTPFLKRIWGNEQTKPVPITTDINLGTVTRPNDAALRKQLTKQQYDVAVCSATEPPFANEYWNNKREGLYVDIISGKPLFSSNDKFNSGTGWPSFTRTVDNSEVVEHVDTSHGMERIEVRSKTGDAHLGHLFNDGPAPTGMRYCINSASLRFIPKEDLVKEGYGEFVKLFNRK